MIAAALAALGASAVARAEPDGAEPPDAAADPFEGVEEVTAWRVETGMVPELVGASTSVISMDDFVGEDKSLADVLSETAGVSVRRFGGAADPAELSIRGATPSQSVVTIDGIRASSILTGGLDLSQTCAPLVESVEITRGAGSVSEGSGAIGGAVNVVTRAGADRATTLGQLSGGAFETISGSLLRADRWKGLDYTAGYCGLSTRGDFEFARPVIRSDGVETRFHPDTATRINNDRIVHGGNLALGRTFGPGQLRLIDLASFSSGGEPGLDSGDGPTAGQLRTAHSRNLSNLVQLRWDGASPFGPGDEFSLAAFNRFERARFVDGEQPLLPEVDLDTRLATTGLRSRDRVPAEFLGRSFVTDLGLDVTGDVLRSNDRNGRSRINLGAHLGEEIPLLPGRLALFGAARLDWTGDFDPRLLPDVALVATPAAWIRLKLQYVGSYRAPSFDELYHPDRGFIRGNPALDPEEAWTLQGGLELDLARLGPFSALRFEIQGFHRAIDESITWILISPRTLAPVNTGRARTNGFELGFSVDWTEYLRLSLNHTFIDSERRSTGERLPGQAENDTFVRLRLGPERAWKLIGELHRIDEIPVSEGGSRTLPKRLVANVSAALNLSAQTLFPIARPRALWLFVDLDNLTDEAVRDALSFPQPGRNLTAGLDFRW
ncbi:MAG: TonB-dependent receptor [Myxococcota bacterium]